MLDEQKIKELSELLKQPIKDVREEGQMTVIEFEDGQFLPLYGGTAGLEGLKIKVHVCSFCGHTGTKEKPVATLNENEEPLICSDCAANAIKLFIQNGVEIELDIPTDSVPEGMLDKFFDTEE